jgi:hypothetical protein
MFKGQTASKLPRRQILRLVAGAAILLAYMSSVTPSLAGPPKDADPALATWFRSLKAPNGTACCSSADCRPTDIRLSGDGYDAMIDGAWVPVPWERVLRRTDNPTSEAVVCRVPGTSLILCFVRPPDM